MRKSKGTPLPIFLRFLVVAGGGHIFFSVLVCGPAAPSNLFGIFAYFFSQPSPHFLFLFVGLLSSPLAYHTLEAACLLDYSRHPLPTTPWRRHVCWTTLV
eukprot:Hpha_TRINITY_DN11765_c0_g1::TRINITY_DN11765_c0_g1_i1::g.31826::m.31826